MLTGKAAFQHWQADLRPGGPNLILLCEMSELHLEPPEPLEMAMMLSGSNSSHPLPPDCATEVVADRAASVETCEKVVVKHGPGPHRLVALAAGCEVAGEVSLTNLAVVEELRGAGLGRWLALELLWRLR